MSTTSTTTASAARDHVASDVADLSKFMCIFILTRGDGTLFDASSILEEDIIEICVWLGHTHPEGVLWHSTIKLVMLFHTTDQLQIMAWGVVKATTLHNEAISVRTSPPSATHVWDYMAAVTGEPPASNLHPLMERRNPHTSPSTHTWVENPAAPQSKPWGPHR